MLQKEKTIQMYCIKLMSHFNLEMQRLVFYEKKSREPINQWSTIRVVASPFQLTLAILTQQSMVPLYILSPSPDIIMRRRRTVSNG